MIEITQLRYPEPVVQITYNGVTKEHHLVTAVQALVDTVDYASKIIVNHAFTETEPGSVHRGERLPKDSTLVDLTDGSTYRRVIDDVSWWTSHWEPCGSRRLTKDEISMVITSGKDAVTRFVLNSLIWLSGREDGPLTAASIAVTPMRVKFYEAATRTLTESILGLL